MMFEKKRDLIILMSLLSIFVLCGYVIAAYRIRVNYDAGYYLGVVELVHEGLTPYRDFSLDYTPLFFYLFQVPRLMMGQFPVYLGYMVFYYVFEFANALLFYLFVKRALGNLYLAWGGALLFLMYEFVLEGRYLVLEPISLFFGLLSLLIIGFQKQVGVWRLILSGVASAMAFLSKQYGLLFVGTIGLMLLISNESWKDRIMKCFWFAMGNVVIVGVAVVFFKTQNVEPILLWDSLMGSGYGERNTIGILKGIGMFFVWFPFVLYISVLMRGPMKIKKNQYYLVSFMGIILSLCQFYFNTLSHYYLFCLPFVLFLGMVLFKLIMEKRGWKSLKLLFLVLLFAPALSFFVYCNVRIVENWDYRESQIEVSQQLRPILASHGICSALCYNHTIPYYCLCPIHPSLIKEYGYSFGYELEDDMCVRLEASDCFVIKDEDMWIVEKWSGFYRILMDEFYVCEGAFNDHGVNFFIKNGK